MTTVGVKGFVKIGTLFLRCLMHLYKSQVKLVTPIRLEHNNGWR